MENKYYTPSIEEFHVGFEFEKLSTCNGEEFWAWEHMDPIHLEENYLLETIDELIEFELVRVKYLDQFDIESLGFKYTGGTLYDSRDKQYVNNGWVLIESFQSKKIIIYFNNPKFSTLNGEIDILFNGTIKNKSELIKVLKQIGYE